MRLPKIACTIGSIFLNAYAGPAIPVDVAWKRNIEASPFRTPQVIPR